MANFSIKETKEKAAEAKNNIEAKSSQIEMLKQKKEKILETQIALEGANIDEDSKAILREAIASMLEQVESDAESVSDEISESTGVLEESMQKTQEVGAETEKNISGMEKRAAFLESIGIHGVFEGPIKELESDRQSIEAVQAEIVEARKMGEDAQRVASTVKN